MFSKLTIFALTLMLVGCSSVRPSVDSAWRACDTDGDKPGIGIELSRTSGGISAFMYILDPNKPGDFSAGIRESVVIHEATEQEIRFSVQSPQVPKEEMILRLDTPLAGSSVRGELHWTDPDITPVVFTFVRVR